MSKLWLGIWLIAAAAFTAAALAADQAPNVPEVGLPLQRTAYFVGENVPLVLRGGADKVKLEAVGPDGATLLYEGAPGPVILDTTRLAPGDYRLEVNGTAALPRLSIVGTDRASVASFQDESVPDAKMAPDDVVRILRESGLTCLVSFSVADAGRMPLLDTLARAGTLLMVSPDTRPTSFNPVGNYPPEIDGMSQRMILTAQANARHPNFMGFLYGWDTTGYAIGGRKQLLVYWGWAGKEQLLREYIDRVDQYKEEEFTRKTGLKPVTEEEYIQYVLSIGRPEQAPAIDLPTKLWLDEIARYIRPMPDAERAAFETRLDAWSEYLMGLYRGAYRAFGTNLAGAAPGLANSSSVQIDHAPTRSGQYFPWAYQPLDFQYQTTWNDQVGGPDYDYQVLFTAALLDMARGSRALRMYERPTWLSNALATAHSRAAYPGKFTRIAAHGLPYGVTGIGTALEGFSNIMGGMNRATHWDAMKGKAGQADAKAGKEFIDRFASLALACTPQGRIGILFSRHQYGRQNIAMGFGVPSYQALVSLARLGYTPRFVTEDDLVGGTAGERGADDLAGLLILGQTVPLPDAVMGGLARLQQRGALIVVDGNTTVAIPGAKKLEFTFPRFIPGKPHNWSVPNMAAGDNDTFMEARWHRQLAPALLAAFGETGRALYTPERGADSNVTVLQLYGGPAAWYLIAVNDSFVKTQADWFQVRETLVPSKKLDPNWVVYDCTEEKMLGKTGPIACDLTATTARVYAVMRRPMALAAATPVKPVRAGDVLQLVVNTEARDPESSAVVPYHIEVVRPDKKVFYAAYGSTAQQAPPVRIPANAPAGMWSQVVRSQLDGAAETAYFAVEQAEPAPFARPLPGRVIVRGTPALEDVLKKGARLVVPVFDSPRAAEIAVAAEKVKETLAAKGVEVEIRTKPAMATYTLAYALTDAQKAENARVDAGEAIGRIRRETVNSNDWFSALSGYRFSAPLVLLDIAGVQGDCPMAEQLDKAGLLWPQLTGDFPGKGGAVIQTIAWAFFPRQTTVVIQARDAEGLLAGAGALADPPADLLTGGILAAGDALRRRQAVGGAPAAAAAPGEYASSARNRESRPQPFRIEFPGDRPPTPEDVRAPEPPVRPARPVPGVLTPKELVTWMLDSDGRWIEAGTASVLCQDLRFSQAQLAILDVKEPVKLKVVYDGQFRYSDREPRSQPQWESILAIRKKVVPPERRPMAVEVQLLSGKAIGRLVPVRTEERDVPVETFPSYEKRKPRTVREEVVVRLEGEVDLPAGRQEVLLIHRNMVDGVLSSVTFGEPQQ